MINSRHGSIEEFDDVESINMYAELCRTETAAEAIARINFGGRDNTRRPMCWSGGENGGFGSGKPWIPLHSHHQTINLEADLASDKSVWGFYRDLLHLRLAHKALTAGTFAEVTRGEGYCAYERSYGDEKLLIVCNFEQENRIDLPGMTGELLLSNYGLTEKQDALYAPYEVAVFGCG